MTFGETLDYLYSRLPVYQRVGKSAYKKDLTNTLKLLDAVGNPHTSFKSVHIAGTNGKGTSAHGIAAILQTAGYSTGLYTSPHLKRFTERIRINGTEIEEGYVTSFIEDLKSQIELMQPSFFELTVVMAFKYFADKNIDIAIIETGLGGRLDSTNVLHPLVSLITNIGYDHMDMLGETLEKIASEKAGIIKTKIPVVIGEVLPETKRVFEIKAAEMESAIHYPDHFEWSSDPFTPSYFEKNVPGMVKVCQILNDKGFSISSEEIEKGLHKIHKLTGLKGRFQLLGRDPLVIADISHNEDGLRILFDQLENLNKRNLHIIFGTIKDKDLAPLFNLFPKDCKVYWTQSSVPRSLLVEELAIQAIMKGLEGECFKDVNEAISVATKKASVDDTIVVTGSTFVIAEIDDL